MSFLEMLVRHGDREAADEEKAPAELSLMRLGAMGGTPSRVRDHPTAGRSMSAFWPYCALVLAAQVPRLAHLVDFAIEKTLLYISGAAREEVPYRP